MELMNKGCEEEATKAKGEAARLKAEANPTDKSSMSRFDSCLSNFDDILDYLQQGLTTLLARDIATSTYDDFIREPNVDPSSSKPNPMENVDENLINMIGNALAFVNKNKALF